MANQSIPQLFDLKGRAAVVTGAGRGLGQACALRLAEAGASLLLTDIDMETVSQTVEQIKAQGGQAKALHADAGRIADAPMVMQSCIDSFGHIDILVNNAGIFPMSPALETTEELWDRVHDINLKGMFFCSQAAAREMVKSGRGGKIINMASTDSLHPRAGAAHYNASKGGVLMLTKALALEWAQYKITVNAVAPGGVLTPGTLQQRAKFANVDIETAKARRLLRQPVGYLGEPDEIAKAVLFLASAASDYMTGSIIVADGGFLLT